MRTTSCGVAFVALALAAGAAAQPQRVFVYGSDLRDNGYNSVCHGYSWQTAGFLDANGRPLRVNNRNEIINAGGQVVGSPITGAGGGVVGWTNAATRESVVDLNMGRLTDAFALFNANPRGMMQIMRHGGSITPGRQDGGTIFLDVVNRRVTQAAGFKNGTGVPRFMPYDVDGPGNGRIRLRLYSCFSGNDPDGNGPLKSVKASAEDIRGVTEVLGSVPVVQTLGVPRFEVVGGANPQQQQAIERYARSLYRRGGGLLTAEAFIAALPFDQHYAFFENQLGRVNIPRVGNFRLEWTIRYRAVSDLERVAFNMDFPVTFESAVGGTISHRGPLVRELNGHVVCEELEDFDDIPEFETLHLGRLAAVNGTVPDPLPGLKFVGGIFELKATDSLLEGVSGRLVLDLLPRTILSATDVYVLEGSRWTPLTTNRQVVQNPGGYDQIGVDFSRSLLGTTGEGLIFTAMSVPAPGTAALLGLAAVMGGRRRRR